jgi:hypothetical protein
MTTTFSEKTEFPKPDHHGDIGMIKENCPKCSQI